MQRRPFNVVPPLLCLLATAATTGCSSRTNQPITLIASGDTAGWITPCGCASNQSGGLLRRATLLTNNGKNSQLVYVDAGGSASGTSEYQLVKLAAILRGLQAMDLVAHNIGGPESALDPATVGKLAEETGVTWLSANLTSASGNSPAKPAIVV